MKKIITVFLAVLLFSPFNSAIPMNEKIFEGEGEFFRNISRQVKGVMNRLTSVAALKRHLKYQDIYIS